MASTDNIQTVSGYTKAEFVSAATALGANEANASAAWGNEQAMAQFPVSSTISGGGTASNFAASRSLSASGPYSGSCSKDFKNLFGGVIAKITVTKTYNVSGNAVVPVNSSYSTQDGFGWAFQIINQSQDYFTAANGDAKGSHTTQRQGRWSSGVQGDQKNLSASVTAYAWSPYKCG
jgi:hypothetical protein